MINIFQIVPTFLWPLIAIVVLVLAGTTLYWIGFISGKANESELWKRGQKKSRSVLGGLISEQVAPFLPDFPTDLKASEARFIGKPIDFIIFKGMDEQDISEVVFVEIKSGNAQLSTNQRKLRDAINDKKVRWHEYRVNDGVTKISEESTQKTIS
jgi:predicted Holliday junction resolvase-like endonuclease